MTDIELSKRMQLLREKAGLTQRKLAEQLNVTVQTVSNWETGHREPRMTPVQTLKLCRALNCSLEDLSGAITAKKEGVSENV